MILVEEGAGKSYSRVKSDSPDTELTSILVPTSSRTYVSTYPGTHVILIHQDGRVATRPYGTL